MFAFPLDRYDYIESHSGNEDMKIPKRLHWFSEELTKPAGYNNPASIMSGGPHPLDDDACNVAGLTVTTCVAAREKVNKMYKDITAAYPSYDERLLNCISKYLKADPDTMMAVLRELFRQLVASKPDRERILKRAKDGADVFGKIFQQITSAQQTELLAIITI